MPRDIVHHSDRIDLITAAYERHHAALLGFVYDRLDVLDHHLGEDLAAEVWRRITESADRVDQRVVDLTWLQVIARAVLREHTSPTRYEAIYVPQEHLATLQATTPAPALSIAA